MNPIHTLDELACCERLKARSFGRLAYHLVDQVDIVPLNYSVSNGRQLLFRTAEGSKLLAVVMNADVAFEVDDLQGNTAWSVIARGQARWVEGQEARDANALVGKAWVDVPKHHIVAIDVTEVTGRTFDLDRP